MNDQPMTVVLQGARPAPPGALSNALAFGWRAALKFRHVPEQMFDLVMTPIMFTLLFTFVFAVVATRWKSAEKIMVPLLDVLQSVPILGFQAIAVAPFIALFPGNLFGVELAALFAIFTSQAWNMAFKIGRAHV